MHGGSKPTRRVILDLIRHGEPEGGVKYRGSLDEPLSETGWQQLRATCARARQAGASWQAVVASPLLRCHNFAQEIAVQQQLPLTVVPDLREICFGEIEGMRPADAWAKYPELLTNLWQAPELHTPPGGEPFGDFIVRVDHALRGVINDHIDQHILLVVHGGVIRASLTACFGFTPRATFCVDVPYAGMTRIRAYVHDDGHMEFSLAFINGFTDH